jgi:DNA-binding beta-propeller fold protein YncE
MSVAVALAVAGAAAPVSAGVAATRATASALTSTPVGAIGAKAQGRAGLYGWGAATMLDGSILLGDYWGYRVVHYDAVGNEIGSFIYQDKTTPKHALSFSPYGMAVDPNDGSVYISDTNGHVIEKYDSSGHWKFTIGSKGSGPGQFIYPSRLTVDSGGNLWVADAWQNKIEVFDSLGNFLGQFGTLGSGASQFRGPHGVEFDGLGRLWVVDTNNYRVSLYQPGTLTPTFQAPTYLFSFGTKGGGGQPCSFNGELRGLAMDDTNGWAYVVDSSGWVDKYSQSVTTSTCGTSAFLGTLGGPCGTGNGCFTNGGREDTVDNNGNVWVGDMPNFRAQVFLPTPGLPAHSYDFQVPNPPAPPPLGFFNGPRGVAFDLAGDMFVSDTYNERIEKFGPSPTYTYQTNWGNRDNGVNGFNYPRLMAFDPQTSLGGGAFGALVVADTDNNRIKAFDTSGNLIWSVGLYGLATRPCTAGGQVYLFDPYSLDVDPSTGTVYVADSNNSRIVRLDSAGNLLGCWGTKGNGNGQFAQLRGVHFDTTDNTVWTSQDVNAEIQHFSASGTPIGSPIGRGTVSLPFGITSDATNIYVADAPLAVVWIFRKSDGTQQGTIGTLSHAGSAPGLLSLPQSAGFGPNGDLYVVEQGNDRVQEFSLS